MSGLRLLASLLALAAAVAWTGCRGNDGEFQFPDGDADADGDDDGGEDADDDGDAASDADDDGGGDGGGPSATFFGSCTGDDPDTPSSYCTGDERCVIMGTPPSMCTTTCTEGDDTTCPAGFTCYPAWNGTPICTPTNPCDGGSCPTGEECLELGCLGDHCVPTDWGLDPPPCA